MLAIRTAEEMACALRSPPDPQIGHLLQEQWDRLSEWTDFGLEELALFIIAQMGDTPDQASAELGQPLISNGQFALIPELIQQRGHWAEVTVILSQDGFGLVLMVELGPATDSAFLSALANASDVFDLAWPEPSPTAASQAGDSQTDPT